MGPKGLRICLLASMHHGLRIRVDARHNRPNMARKAYLIGPHTKIPGNGYWFGPTRKTLAVPQSRRIVLPHIGALSPHLCSPSVGASGTRDTRCSAHGEIWTVFPGARFGRGVFYFGFRLIKIRAFKILSGHVLLLFIILIVANWIFCCARFRTGDYIWISILQILSHTAYMYILFVLDSKIALWW